MLFAHMTHEVGLSSSDYTQPGGFETKHQEDSGLIWFGTAMSVLLPGSGGFFSGYLSTTTELAPVQIEPWRQGLNYITEKACTPPDVLDTRCDYKSDGWSA